MKNLLLLAGVFLALIALASPVLADHPSGNCKAPIIVSN